MIKVGLDQVHAPAKAEGLDVLGGSEPADDNFAHLPLDTHYLMLLGPARTGFWPHFMQTPEWQAGFPDPMDLWSARVISAMAMDLGGRALFPFGGSPYLPFYT